MATHVAHDAVDQGGYVFQLRRRSKEPLGNCDACGADNAPCSRSDVECPCWSTGGQCHGFRAATNDHRVIDQWDRLRPGLNWGVSTGPSDLLVVDLDTKATTVPPVVLPAHLRLGQPSVANGVELFSHVMRALSGADRLTTRVIRTPSGGFHAYFRPADGIRYTGKAGKLGWSIDVRAVGGYVVLPGSTTPDGDYVVVRDLPILSVPDWLDRWLTSTGHREGVPGIVDQAPRRTTVPIPAAGSSATRAQRYALAALTGKCQAIAAMPPVRNTKRDTTLNRAAYAIGGYVAAGALDESTAVDALTEAGLACGLTEGAVARTVKSGMAAGMRKPSAIGGVA